MCVKITFSECIYIEDIFVNSSGPDSSGPLLTRLLTLILFFILL